MISQCNNCGGLYSDIGGECIAGRLCVCVSKAQTQLGQEDRMRQIAREEMARAFRMTRLGASQNDWDCSQDFSKHKFESRPYLRKEQHVCYTCGLVVEPTVNSHDGPAVIKLVTAMGFLRNVLDCPCHVTPIKLLEAIKKFLRG